MVRTDAQTGLNLYCAHMPTCSIRWIWAQSMLVIFCLLVYDLLSFYEIMALAITHKITHRFTVLPAKSESDVMFCSQSYLGLGIDRSLVY